MLNRSASLAMSTSVLKALPGKLDIKRHSLSIIYILQRLNREMYSHLKEVIEDEVTEDGDHNTCPNPVYKYKQSLNYAQKLRLNLKDYVKSSYPENVG